MGSIGSAVGGVASAATGKGAAKDAEKSGRVARSMTREQLDMLRAVRPYLEQMGVQFGGLIPQVSQDAQDAYNRGLAFDPAKETDRAMQAYDMAARESLSTELGNTNTPFSMRGFTQGNASSDQYGANADLLSRRANDRGQYMANLRLRETDRKDEVTGRASDRLTRGFQLLDPTGRSTSAAGALQGPVNTMLQQQQMYGQQAASANPGALIPIVGDALKGVKWPWQKKSDPYGPFIH